MKREYPRYCRELKGSLYYQRDFPISLRVFGKKTFTKPLELKKTSHTDSELQRAIATATEAFELQVKMMQNSNADDYTDAELDKAAAEHIRRLGLKAGQFESDSDFMHYADEIIVGLDDAVDSANYGELTAEEMVKVRAYRALGEAASKKPKMLSQVWSEYLAKRNIDVTTRIGKRKQKGWDRLFAYIGEQKLDGATTLAAIHDGIDRYWVERREAGAKVQSIRREYAETLAALNLANNRHRLGWVLVPNSEGNTKDDVTEKVTLSDNELIALVKHCLADTETPEVSAAILFMAQSGAMCSEIERLNINEVLVDLNAAIPQISIGRDSKIQVKNAKRRRVVPIVLGADYLRLHIGEAIEWCRRTTESNVSRRIGVRMKKVTGNNAATAHCLRHTLKALSDITDANATHMAAICGWAGGEKIISRHMQQYGAEGLSRSEGFIAVTATSRKILAHVIEAVKADQGNVVSIRAKK
jgi:integrase